jgi:hypothetical protein
LDPTDTFVDHYLLEAPAGDEVPEVYFDVTLVTKHYIDRGVRLLKKADDTREIRRRRR